MKLATAAILVAAMPAYAEDYTMLCPDSVLGPQHSLRAADAFLATYSTNKPKMKFAIVAALVGAAMPAYALNDYLLSCSKDLYSGTYARVLYVQLYSQVCKERLGCNGQVVPSYDAKDAYWVGQCKGCEPISDNFNPHDDCFIEQI
ncbi:hypothetical protein E4U55_004421 [Claviceps digitariae]|nr:hypothetical protein E4U55_004421 [Claviceps digitariae]